jgi:hypothetical protein
MFLVHEPREIARRLSGETPKAKISSESKAVSFLGACHRSALTRCSRRHFHFGRTESTCHRRPGERNYTANRYWHLELLRVSSGSQYNRRPFKRICGIIFPEEYLRSVRRDSCEAPTSIVCAKFKQGKGLPGIDEPPDKQAAITLVSAMDKHQSGAGLKMCAWLARRHALAARLGQTWQRPDSIRKERDGNGFARLP